MEGLSYNRYKGGTQIKDFDGIWLIPRAEGFNTSPRPDDRFHIVKQGDRVDLLAHKYLGDARLWWIICEYNNIFWMFDLVEGNEIRLPSYNYMQMELLI